MKRGMSKMLQFHWFRAFLTITLSILGVSNCKKAHFKGNVPNFMKMKKGMSKMLQCHWFRAYLTITLSILGVSTCKKANFKGN